MNRYVYIKEPISITISLGEILLSVEDKSNRKGESLYTLNKDALNIIEKFTGQYTLDEIIEQLSNYYNEELSEIKYKLEQFLKLIKNTYNLNIEYSSKKIKKEILIRDNEDTCVPRVISIELTHKCNFKCIHCYGEYDNQTLKTMDINKLKIFLRECKELGVEVIELTGGEITMHPNISEIVSFIHQLGFRLVTLLTNGYIRNQQLYDVIIQNKQNTVVQIDLHGNTEEYLEWFIKVPNTLEIAKENIKYLRNNGVTVRVVTVVTPRNVDQIEEIAEWVHNLGVQNYGISPVIPEGRGNKDDSKLLFTDIESFNRFQEVLNNLAQKYERKFLNLVDNDGLMKSRCGALVSNPSLSPNGDIKLCSMDGLDITKSIGNVFEKSFKEIYENKLDFIHKFKELSSPNIQTSGCEECDNLVFCSGCILRAFKSGLEKGDKCLWFKEMVPDEIKETLIKTQTPALV